MKTKRPLLNLPGLLAGVLLACALRLPAQSPPVITTQPVGQTNLPGTTATFTVAVSGPGPFTYQWLFNGTNLPNNIITTVAGNGVGTYAGDGGPATNASLNNPCGVALDAFGNLYISDYGNNRIRKMATNGIISTVAGNGTAAYAGDGGAATNANLYSPSGVALDAFGRLYIADHGDNRIRAVYANGVIATVAGNGTSAFAGDGGTAINASLNNPSGVALDVFGNLYIADTGNNRIRMVSTNGVITTVAGNGRNTFAGDGGAATNASLEYPAGLAFDAFGNLYIADWDDGRIRAVDTNGVITTVAGNGSATYAGDGGAATNTSLYDPFGVACDALGNLYIADYGNNRIRMVLYSGSPTLTLGNIGATNAGNYSVVITSPYGSVTSAVTTLTVAAPAAITVQPINCAAAVGSNPSFSVTAIGSGSLGYLWYFDSTNLLQNGANSTLTLSSVTTNNAGNYMVVITNSYGSVTSQVAALTVGFPPSVTSQPVNQTNLMGTTASFNVSAGGTGPFTYQWQFNGTNLPNGIITTVAGGGSSGLGDGSLATYASLDFPYGAAFDANGNLYIADMYDKRIREVTTSGMITTVAGNGNITFGGDGGPATSASLYYPSGVAFDAVGNLYIADQIHNRIRKVAGNGIITTVAGNGGGGYFGDEGVATNANLNNPTGVALDSVGNLYISDQNNERIRKVTTNGIIMTVAGNGTGKFAGDGGAATNASLWYPTGVVLDAFGNLYIADNDNNRIRMVQTNGIITTVAGGGSSGLGDGGAATNASLHYPSGVNLDIYGNLYIADYSNSRIRKVATNGIITTVAGNGSSGYNGDGEAATNAELYFPAGVSLDASGNLYIADRNNNRLRKVWLYAGNPTLTLSQIGAANAGNYSVVISNSYGSVTSAVVTLTVQSPPIFSTQPASQFAAIGNSPSFSVAVTGTPPFNFAWYFNATNLVQSGPTGTLTLSSVTPSNAGNYTVVITNNYGSVTSQVATLTVGLSPSVATQPAGQTNLAGATVSFNVTPGGSGPFTYQWQFNGTYLSNNIITTVAGAWTNSLGDGGMATNAELWEPAGVVFDVFGNLYIADEGNNRIRKVAANGIITTVAGNGTNAYAGDGGAATNASLGEPTRVNFDAFGNLYIADYVNCRVRKVAPNGIITTVAGNGWSGETGNGGPAISASLTFPDGVAFDAGGNLYVPDQAGNQVRRVNTNGIISTVAGNVNTGYSGDGGAATSASMHQPSDVAFDGLGNLYIADLENSRIRMVATNGIITTVAGNGGWGYSGDGGAATNASLYGPQGIAVDAFGNLYIGDQGNQRIRKVGTNGIITTVAGNGRSGYSGDGGPATSASLAEPQSVALDAVGNLYIADWGNDHIREVNFAGSPTLILPTVSVTNAGNYSVVITSPYGSVTSSVATLTVTISTTPPQIISSGTNFGFLTNQFGFNLNGAYGQTIVVDGSTNLLNWSPLFTNTANGTPFYFYDPAWTNFPWRFYRARLP